MAWNPCPCNNLDCLMAMSPSCNCFSFTLSVVKIYKTWHFSGSIIIIVYCEIIFIHWTVYFVYFMGRQSEISQQNMYALVILGRIWNWIGPTNGGNLRKAIMHIIISATQKTESFAYHWLCALQFETLSRICRSSRHFFKCSVDALTAYHECVVFPWKCN